MDGAGELGHRRDVSLGLLGGNQGHLQKWCALAYDAAEWGCRIFKRTGCDSLRPQLVVFELIHISPHEATGLDGLERH